MDNELKLTEKMDSFFNERADGYDTHMKNIVISFDEFYYKISEPINQLKKNIEILDIGCGTGIEIQYLFDQNPNIKITAVDLSEKMLAKLKEKYKNKINQITVVNNSYLEFNIKENFYDYIISVMTLHHLTYDKKINLYKKIYNGLKDNSYYIEGDYIVSKNDEELYLEKYNKQTSSLDMNKKYHIDIPFSIETQIQLYKEANFKNVEIIFQTEKSAVFKVKK